MPPAPLMEDIVRKSFYVAWSNWWAIMSSKSIFQASLLSKQIEERNKLQRNDTDKVFGE